MSAPDSAAPSAHRPPPVWRLWDNPILRRYCRSRLRARGLSVSLIITLVVSGFFFLLLPLISERATEVLQNSDRDRMMETAEQFRRDGNPAQSELIIAFLNRQLTENPYHQRAPLLALLGVQALILFFIGTGQVAGGMTAESDEGSVDYQRLTPLTPLGKTLGYLFGLPVREYVLFLATLPMTALCLWRGEVPLAHWGPVYGIFLCSVVLYHLTGLVAGTVLKSKRWAFLLSMGLIFVLYTLVPQGARLGFPFVEYLTAWPVLTEHLAAFLPRIVPLPPVMTGEAPGIAFFNTRLSAPAFTLMVQGTFILTLLVMVWRKWRRAESHLLSKAWAVLVFIWLHVIILGNAIPMAEDGTLFPIRGLNQAAQAQVAQAAALAGDELPEQAPPEPSVPEASIIVFLFAVELLIAILLMIIMVTPSGDRQTQGLRRAFRRGKRGAPVLSDESSALPVTLLLVLAGVATWHLFQRSVLGSHWFTVRLGGMGAGWSGTLRVAAALGLTAIVFHAMLEARGPRRPFLAAVFLGVVPVMAALLAQVTASGVSEPALWIAGISPLPQLGAAVELMLPENLRIQALAERRLPLISGVWITFMLAAAVWHWRDLSSLWRARRQAVARLPDTAPAP